jgi:hypothetical protein
MQFDNVAAELSNVIDIELFNTSTSSSRCPKLSRQPHHGSMEGDKSTVLEINLFRRTADNFGGTPKLQLMPEPALILGALRSLAITSDIELFARH